jgi:hypothetical protein
MHGATIKMITVYFVDNTNHVNVTCGKKYRVWLMLKYAVIRQ